MSVRIMSTTNKDFPELKELDSLLRCGICYEYMKNTQITSCSHNYCSYCIRKFMLYKPQCPTCFKETTEPQLRSNRLIDELIVLFEKMREKIEDITFDRDCVPESTLLAKGNSEVQPSNSTTEVKNDSVSVDEGQDTGKIKIMVPDMFTPRRKVKRRTPVVTEPVKLVPCPVCAVDIPERNINTHLDHCLSKPKEEPPEVSTKPIDRRKPLSKLVYPLLQEKELRRKLKEIGLSTVGDRKALINRHQRFIVLYNSECDSLNPLSVAEIVEQVATEEKLEKKIASTGNTFAMTKTWLSVSKKTDAKTIEIAQKEYLEENKNSFALLVEKIKQQKRPPSAQSDENDYKDRTPSPPFGDKSPCSSPVVRSKRKKRGTALFSSDGEDNDVFKEWLERDTLEYENSAVIRRPKRRKNTLQSLPFEGEQRVLRKRTKK